MPSDENLAVDTFRDEKKRESAMHAAIRWEVPTTGRSVRDKMTNKLTRSEPRRAPLLQAAVIPWLGTALLVVTASCRHASGPTMEPSKICTERATTDTQLDTGSGVLAATLEIPAGCGPTPVALIHAGSGPTDRNGNSAALAGRNDSLKLLAEQLAQRQIASVRFDKRGIAASATAGPGNERDFRFSVLVDDTVRWLRKLADDRRFSGVVMVGHSEGALIGLLAASSVPLRGFVSLAGPGQRAGASLREQLARQINGPLLTQANETIAELEAGREVADVPPVLAALFRPSVQPYLIEWLTHDPVRLLAALSAPALVVQGTTDLQISVDDARRLAAARPDIQLLVVPGMNHVLKLVDGDIQAQLPSYGDPSLPLPAPLLTAVSDFISRVAR